jgi:RNA polymerase sigma-70 factor (ECF subfamily)
VRRQTPTREDAEDLTQAFFARFLEKNCLEKLSSQKGKFRAFLLAALKHFLANEWDRANSQKRGAGLMPLSLDWQNADARYQIEPVDNLSPDKVCDRAWAITLLQRVLACGRECHRGQIAALRAIATVSHGGLERCPLWRSGVQTT